MQFEIVFPDEYILESEARSLLERPNSKSAASATASQLSSSIQDRNPSDLEKQVPLSDNRDEDKGSEFGGEGRVIEVYEEMILHGQKFLCEIPAVKDNNKVESSTSTTDEEKELARATDRGLELLREMEGKCLYYAAGWWSYSFCYMDEVRQFHAVLPGNGVPAYPPLEDRTTHSFVLGKFRKPTEEEDDTSSSRKKPTTEVSVRETRGDSRYLVQYLEDGTTCDLTDRPRKIEVQFHCHPHASDHIGWIKEVTTCSYLMVVYTPRLCNDVAFQPPRVDKPHDIVCREILTAEEVPEWEAAKEALERQDLLGEPVEEYPLVGDIEVGAMKLVGRDGKRIEKGKVASPVEEKVEVIARSQKGKIHRLSKDQLKKLKLDPEEIERARTQLDEFAEGQDWKLEMVDVNGARTLRGTVLDETEEEVSMKDKGKTGDDDQKKQDKESKQSDPGSEEESEADDDDFETGSDERFKEEL